MTLCKIRRQSDGAGNWGKELIGSYEVVEGGELIVSRVSHPAGIILPGKPASKLNGNKSKICRIYFSRLEKEQD